MQTVEKRGNYNPEAAQRTYTQPFKSYQDFFNTSFKGCEMAMNSGILLAHENQESHASHENSFKNANDQGGR